MLKFSVFPDSKWWRNFKRFTVRKVCLKQKAKGGSWKPFAETWRAAGGSDTALPAGRLPASTQAREVPSSPLGKPKGVQVGFLLHCRKPQDQGNKTDQNSTWGLSSQIVIRT